MRIDPAVVERTISGILARAPDIRDTLSRREQTIRSRKRPSVDTDRYTQWTAQLLAAGIKPSKLDQERFIGKNDLVELNYLARGIGAARPVGRIHITEPSGRLAGYATGFLVAPGLAITNHHVFPTALDAAPAAIEFGYERNLQGNEVLGTKFGFQPEVFFFSFEPLDFALVAVRPLSLDRGKELSRFGWLRLNPSLGKIDPEQFVTIIQHPAGQPKQLSIRENKLIKIEDNFLVYECDTAPGSSGAPVLNDMWQVVGMHATGVPAKNESGDWLDRNLKPIDRDDASEDDVLWIGNAGVRASRIVDTVRRQQHDHPLIEAFLRTCAGEIGADAGATPANENLAQTITADSDGSVLITVPITLRMSLAEPRPALPSTGAGAAIPASLPAVDGVEEKLNFDNNYSARQGYDADFIDGFTIPLPDYSRHKRDLAVDQTSNAPELRYHHFSVLFNRRRKLALLTACNYHPEFKGSKSRKQLGTDQWRPDPRIARDDQIPKSFYAGNDFDLGHVVKREDAYWGETEKQAESANADTFHLTNCSPQHMSFNRKSEGGIWGALEDAISNQGRDGAFEKMTIFAGPILDKKDREFRGIQIPSAFWKVVVSPRDNGKLAAYAFVLEQKNLIKDLTEEINLQDFEVYQVPLKRIESRTRLEFPEIVQLADVLRKTRPDESLKIERAESIAL